MKAKIKIAIIDSGINAHVFNGIYIEQYSIKDEVVKEEEPKDNIGHGTSVLGIVLKQINEDVNILSIRPVISNGVLSCLDIAKAIMFAVEKDAIIINVSMGTDDLKKRKYVDEACYYAFKKNVIVVCAFSKFNNVIVPWASKYVLKVNQGNENTNNVCLKNSFFESNALSVEKVAFRTVDGSGKPKFMIGHSAAAAYITGQIVTCILASQCYGISVLEFFLKTNGIRYLPNDIFNMVNVIQDKIDQLEDKKTMLFGNAAVIPVSKEMDSLKKFIEYTGINIVAGVDYIKKGRKTGEIPVKASLNMLKDMSIDWLIVGYLDKLEKFGNEWSLQYILDFAINNKYNVFSFLPVDIKEKERFKKEQLILLDTIVYDEAYWEKIRKAVPYRLRSRLPVLGVFGTSSKQGKFTLQMLLRKEIESRKINLLTFATEHQAAIMNTSICFPRGYSGENNIKVDINKEIEIIQKTIFYLEQTTDVEMVLAGAQSWLVPYNVDKQVAINSLAYLEAIRPDYAVVVVNPDLDPEDYIYDTIQCLHAIYKVKVIALAFSDKKVFMKGNAVLTQKRSRENIVQSAQKLVEKYAIFSGCITDANFVREVVDIFLELVKE